MNDFLRYEAQLATIVPESVDAGTRILKSCEDWPKPSEGTLAYSIRGRCLFIRDELKKRGEWTGSFPSAIVFCSEPASESDVLGLMLHEAAHILPANAPIPDRNDEPEGMHQLQLEMLSSSPQEMSNAILRPWRDHDHKFVRRVLHLKFRAEQIGLNVPWRSLFSAGANYGLSPLADFAAELATEPQRCTRMSFKEIEADEPPPGFLRLFARDLKQFFGDQCRAALAECSLGPEMMWS
jgi:hypothetical protein